jgi:putative endonuclease
MKNYWVYMITNFNNTTLYIGVTNNLQRRIYEHKNKLYKGFSEKYNLTKCIYCEETNQIDEAIAREKQLKGWTRKKKNDLINSVNPQWNDLMPE